jgi:hypothetical protein
LFYLLPPVRVFGINTRFSQQSHQFVLSLPRCRTQQFKRCFIYSAATT